MKDFKMLKTTLIFSVMMFIMACSEVKQVESPEQLINRVNEIYTEVAKAYPNEGELPPTNHLDSLYCSSEWNRMLAVIDSIDSKLEGEMGFFDFDYWIMAQDYRDISADSVVVEKMNVDSASVLIQLHNFNHVTPVRLEMVKENDLWMIDNFIDVSNEYNLKLNMKKYIEVDEAMIHTDSIGLHKNDGVVEVKLSVDYPVKGSPLMVKALRKYIATTMGADSLSIDNRDSLLESACQYGYKQMMSLRKEMMYDNETDIPTYFISYDIKKETDCLGYVTYIVNYADYTGGAHGSAYSTGSTFTKKDGKCWEWNMLKDTKSNGFRQLMKEGVRDHFKMFEKQDITDEQLKDMLLIDEDVNHIPLPAWAPYLTYQGVAFAYQQYEIAPYAAGIISFIIPYEKIMPYLVPEIKAVIE